MSQTAIRLCQSSYGTSGSVLAGRNWDRRNEYVQELRSAAYLPVWGEPLSLAPRSFCPTLPFNYGLALSGAQGTRQGGGARNSGLLAHGDEALCATWGWA